MDLVGDICQLPVRLRSLTDVSARKLVDDTGYRVASTDLDLESVRAYLAQHIDLIDAWLGYSEDKRTSSGWYIRGAGDAFEVGIYPRGESLVFIDRVRACAEFVIREIRAIAG